MKTDYHFHPNLHAKNPEKRLRRIWDAISATGLDAMICTEHVYKNAPNAYRRLSAAKPTQAQTHIFPGAELISNDGKGIEIIAFAQEDWYDDHPLLLKPFAMNLAEIIAYLQDSNLHWFIPHPFLPGNPLKQLYPDKEKILEFLDNVPAFEIQNGCYLLLEMFMHRLPGMNRLQSAMHESVSLTHTHTASDFHAFYAIGSDAHHPQDIGLCVDIPVPSGVISRTAAYHALTSNRIIDRIHIPRHAFSLRHLLYTGWTTYSESCMKREWRRYAYQHTAFEKIPASH